MPWSKGLNGGVELTQHCLPGTPDHVFKKVNTFLPTMAARAHLQRALQ
jgi:hypothetical protein